jgi:hypothetical protein
MSKKKSKNKNSAPVNKYTVVRAERSLPKHIPLAYLLYYTFIGIFTSFLFAVSRPSFFDNIIWGIVGTLIISGAINALPLVFTVRYKLPVAMYIVAPVCTVAVVCLALLNIFTMGLIFYGISMGILLFFLSGGRISGNDRRIDPVVVIACAACLVCVMGFTVFREIRYVVHDNMHYVYENKGYTLVEARGKITFVDSNGRGWRTAQVPSEINGKSVKRISRDAFVRHGPEIDVIDIPSGISMPKGLLTACYNLTELRLDLSVLSLYELFDKNFSLSNMLDDYYTPPMLPDFLIGIVLYGESVVSNAVNFTHIRWIEITDTVERIGSEAFAENPELTSVRGSKNLKSIGNDAFRNCIHLGYGSASSVGRVEFGGVLEEIGAHAFSGCSFLRPFELPDTLRVIGMFAFENCASFTILTFLYGTQQFFIPASVLVVGPAIFFCSKPESYLEFKKDFDPRVYVRTGHASRPEGWDSEWDVITADSSGPDIRIERYFNPWLSSVDR